MGLFSLFNPFGGGGGRSAQSASQTATNSTTSTTTANVTVNVPITTDTTPIAAAIDAMRGQGSATALASAAIVAGALKANAAALQSSSGSNTDVQIFVAAIGLIGALFIAHVLK